MATYVMSDIHGCYTMFKQMLDKINFDEEKDHLIVLGDITDRGAEGVSLLEFFFSKKDNKAYTLLMGNHEEININVLKYSQLYSHIDEICTGLEFHKKIKDKNIIDEYIEWLNSLPLFCEYKNFTLTHAGFIENDKNTLEIDLWDRSILKKDYPLGKDKILVCGHTPTLITEYYPSDNKPKEAGKIWHGKGIICIDCGAVFKKNFGGNLGCLNLDTMEEYYI